MKFSKGVAAVALSLLLLTTASFASNLVSNGGFETGDFTGWTLGGVDSSCTAVLSVGSDVNGLCGPQFGPAIVAEGQYAAYLGSYSGGSLTQTLATTPGGAYAIVFDLASLLNQDSQTNLPNEFSVTWDGNTVYDGLNLGVSGFQWTRIPVIASGASTDLTFSDMNPSAYFVLDNVSVTPVPEPASLLLLGTGLAGLLLRKKTSA